MMNPRTKLADRLIDSADNDGDIPNAGVLREAAAEISRLRLALHTALEACRFYHDAADTHALAAAKQWHEDAKEAFDLNP